jgi:hypothetical protein
MTFNRYEDTLSVPDSGANLFLGALPVQGNGFNRCIDVVSEVPKGFKPFLGPLWVHPKGTKRFLDRVLRAQTASIDSPGPTQRAAPADNPPSPAITAQETPSKAAPNHACGHEDRCNPSQTDSYLISRHLINAPYAATPPQNPLLRLICLL